MSARSQRAVSAHAAMAPGAYGGLQAVALLPKCILPSLCAHPSMANSNDSTCCPLKHYSNPRPHQTAVKR